MWLLVLVCLTLAFLAWQWRTKVSNYWAERGVPHEKPHWLFGTLEFLGKINPLEYFNKVYFKYPNSPYFGIWLFWTPALVIRDPEVAKRILVKDADVFRNRQLGGGKYDVIGHNNIFCTEDPFWSYMRKKLSPTFSSSKLRTAFDIVKEKGEEIVQRIAEENEKLTGLMDIRAIFTDYTTDVVGEAVFGMKQESLRTGHSELRSITKDFMTYSWWRSKAWQCLFFAPQFAWLFRFKWFPEDSTRRFRNILNQSVALRGGWQRETLATKDMVDSLINLKQESSKNGQELSDDLILAQAIIMLQGGFDTTGVNLTFTIYTLAYYPDVQKRLYEELVATKEALNGAEFDGNVLLKLPYLNAIIKESLRLNPPMGWLDRRSTAPYKVDDNLTIDKDTPVYILASAIQRDPQYYENPLEFKPERFLPENEQNIKPYTYMPFGEGPRMCIASRFAYQTIRSALATIIQAYEVKPISGLPHPRDIRPNAKGIFLSPHTMLSVKFVPRQ